MSELDKIKQLQTITDFSEYLGYSSKALSYLLYSRDYKDKYIIYSIPKKNGGERIISAPDKKLLKLQKRLSEKLQLCYEEIFSQFSKKYSHLIEKIRASMVHGFRSDLSIQSNALCHIKSNFVLNIDLKDFFPSINFGRVRGFFIKNSFFQLDERIATLIAQTVCYDNKLPQGAPTSPVIANLLATPMDVRILNLVKKKGVFYTRYADDLTFSTKLKQFPNELIVVSETLKYTLGTKLKNIIENSGFLINSDKVRLQLKQSKQTVTGVVVNKKVNVNRKYYKLLRAQCHSLFTKGFYVEKDMTISNTDIKNLQKLEGKLNFTFFTNNYCQNIHETQIKQQKKIHHDNKVKSFSRLGKCENDTMMNNISSMAIKNLYLLYLYYKNFINIFNTTIICEGQTDVFYLKLAYNQLGVSQEKQFNYVKLDGILNKYSDFIGGTGNLKNFIKDYEANVRKFNLPFRYPLIIVVDRDNAGKDVVAAYKGIFSSVKELSEKTVYCNPKNNLYLLVLPKISQSEHVEIEHYLGEDIIKNGINGQSLNLSNKETEKGDFGKVRFSHLVKKNKDTINFENFRLIFDEIRKIEEHFLLRQQTKIL